MNKIKSIYDKLFTLYGPQGWWPIINNKTLLCEYHINDYSYRRHDSERFEMCIGAILTQGTQWYPNVVRAIQQLKLGREFTKQELEVIRKAEIGKGKMFEMPKIVTNEKRIAKSSNSSSAEKPQANFDKLNVINAIWLKKLNIEKLKSAIRPTGYFNQKAKKLKIFTDFYISLKGSIPDRSILLNLWGIGPETADSILLYVYNQPTFVVDAYTKRVLTNHGLIPENAKYEEIKHLIESNLEKDFRVFQEYHALIVEHAKRHYKKKLEISDPCLHVD